MAGWISAQGAIINWTNTAGGNWNVAANWDPNQVPGVNDTAVITNSGTYTVTLNVSETIGNWINSETLAISDSYMYLSGACTNLGTVSVSNATVIHEGVLDNSNSTVVLNGATTLWLLQESVCAIHGGTIVTTNGASLLVNGNGSLLDGVTVDGVLDIGDGGGGEVSVTNGLTLNGTAELWAPGPSTISFNGTQTLGGNGTVVFGNGGLYLASGGTTLTLGPGITVQGENGNIGNGNGSVINQGNIWLDVAGGGLTFNAQPFINEGLVQVINGGANLWGGNWINSGTLAISDSTMHLSSSCTNFGTVSVTNALVMLDGVLRRLFTIT